MNNKSYDGVEGNMKITIQDIAPGEEEEIIVRCRELDEALLRMIHGLKTRRGKFTVADNDKIRQIDAGDIYYFEAVDNKVFLYLEKDVFETRYKLYEIEEEYANTDFFRASKSVIINLAKVKQFAPDFGGRFEAQMRNGERLIISRQYVPALKKRLGMCEKGKQAQKTARKRGIYERKYQKESDRTAADLLHGHDRKRLCMRSL